MVNRWLTLLLLQLSTAEMTITYHRRPGYLEETMSPTAEPTQFSEPFSSPTMQPSNLPQSLAPESSPSILSPTMQPSNRLRSLVPVSSPSLSSPTMQPSNLPRSLAPVSSPSPPSSYLRQKDILLQQSYSSYALTFTIVSSTAFKTAINTAIATILGAPESTIVTSFNPEDCRFPIAGTYHCYLIVYSSFAGYDKAKSILALSSTFEYTALILSKRTGLPIAVSGYRFEQPTSTPTGIPRAAAKSSSSDKGGINQTTLIIAIVVSVVVCLLIGFCLVMRAYSKPRNPKAYGTRTPEKIVVPDRIMNKSRPDEGVIGSTGHHNLGGV